MHSRLDQQLAFIKEVDRLKTILRVCHVIDEDRRENTAEHSWHFALMVMTLKEHAREDATINELHAMKMALIHDIVEIDAGDTYCYDEDGHNDKYERELAAARRIFGMLPDDQHDFFMRLWLEFEEGETPEARFARAMDRLIPFMLNFFNDGKPWIENKIKHSQVMKRMGEIESNCPALWPYTTGLIEEAIANQWILDDR